MPAILCPSQGDIITAPSEADLRQIFFHTDPKYWSQGSGDAGLHRDAEGSNMIFHYAPPYGFCALFQGTGEPPLVLTTPASGDEILKVTLNGNLYFLPRSFLSDAGASFNAALHYLNTGSLKPKHHWKAFDAVLADSH